MVSPMKLGIGGGCLFTFGILIGWIVFPPFLRSQIKKSVGLKPGTEMRELWSNFPCPLDFKIYLFNVTNANEIKDGAMPIVQEVGPFFYDEYKQKVDMVDREEDDTLEYNMKATWYFNPAKSNGLTGDEELIFPHVFILSMVGITLIEKPTAVGIINKAVDSIFKKPDSVFVRAKAKDILFDGLPIDCTVKDFAGSAVCSILREQGKDLVKTGEDQYLFSLFGPKNGTVVPERLRVIRGIKNYKDVGRVTEYDGKPSLSIWPTDYCNTYNGTDTTIFPPLFGPEDDIVSFSADICRSISAKFHSKTKIRGINTLRYKADLGDMSKNELEKCFCPTPDTCLTKNLYDMTKCLGAPLIGSMPHFYDSEEKYVLEGLHPNEKDHGMVMDFEPMTATPLSARKRLQFSMFLQPVEKFKLMKNFPHALLPLFWIEEGIELPDEFVSKLKTVFTLMTVVGVMKWLMVLGGVGMGGAAAGFHFKNKGNSNKLDITKVTPQSGSRTDSSQEKKWPPQMNISTIQSAAVPPNLDRD